MDIHIPEFSLVLMYGASGAGKSTFARKYFSETEIISSDRIRAMLCDDENNQEVNSETFEILHLLLDGRLKQRRLTVIDATNLIAESRRPILELAKKNNCPVFAICLEVPLRALQRRRRSRKDRTIPADVVRAHFEEYQRNIKPLKNEGLRRVIRLQSLDDIKAVRIVRTDAWAKGMKDTGPFDLIGDVHGCYDELLQLLDKLDYKPDADDLFQHPEGRKLVFVGDLVDRGPNSPGVMKLVMDQCDADLAYCAPGNHDMKLWRKLMGNTVVERHGLEVTLEQLKGADKAFTDRFIAFCDNCESHLILDEGRLIVVHAGIKERFIRRSSKRIWSFALYGDVTGKLDEHGFPIRGNWAINYQGSACVVYGHTPIAEPEWLNNTINIDTGCVFGHRLTALRYPERELVCVQAAQNYYPKTSHPAQSGSGSKPA